jgi:hypothetical protein
MNNIKVIENFLDKDSFYLLKKEVESDMFPWYFNVVVLEKDLNKKMLNKYNFQFTHTFFINEKINSDYINILETLINKINPSEIFRIKINNLPVSKNKIEHGYHIDYPNATTCIFYINSNNGYTKFKKNNKKIISKENKIVFFNSNLQHTGSTCTDSSSRIVLNINFKGGPYEV